MNRALPEEDQARPLLRLEQAAFGYGAAPVVAGAGFSIFPGDFYVLTGPNGCGKTTLLRGLLGLVPYRAGKVEWSVRPDQLGYVPQETGIDADVPASCLDVVLTGCASGSGASREQALAALALLELQGLARRRFGSLSGGQKRRVLVARALLGSPSLLLLDEPTANVDAPTEAALRRVLDERRRKDKVAILATTHHLDWTGSARVLRIEEGTVHV